MNIACLSALPHCSVFLYTSTISLCGQQGASLYLRIKSAFSLQNHRSSYAGRYANREFSYREERSSPQHSLFNIRYSYITPCQFLCTSCNTVKAKSLHKIHNGKQ